MSVGEANTPHGLRFVVGSLASPEQAVGVVDDLVKQDLPRSAIGMLVRQDALPRDAPAFASLDGNAAQENFDLLTSRGEKILCFGQGLSRLLTEGVTGGSNRLNDALQHWLLPRHARSLAEIVERGWILIWAKVRTPEEERTANLSLLRSTRGTVQAHDFCNPN